MRSSSVIKVKIPADRISCLGDSFVGSQIDLLVFDAAPQPLDEHVVPPGALAVHADGEAPSSWSSKASTVRMRSVNVCERLISTATLPGGKRSLTHTVPGSAMGM